MVWMEKNTVSLRQEFVQLALQEGANKRELCRRFGISPKTGYKWLARFEADPLQRPEQSLADRSRRPHKCNSRSPEAVEQAVVNLRLAHPAWGGRKITQRLVDLGQAHVAPSTVTHILHRHGLITPEASCAAQPWQRFEHEQPNSLWQMDFKGHFPTLKGLCHPLTVLDDHSRFSLAIHALVRTDTQTVQARLVQVFSRYGLPTRINTDNGAPWGSPSSSGRSLSELAVWLIRLGVRMSFSAPRHPQTNGKLERLHRSLNKEVIAGRNFKDHACAQAAFDEWREIYNCQRPHQALTQQVPARRYRISPLSYPDTLPDIAYPDSDVVAKPNSSGFIYFQGRRVRTSSALRGLPVGVRPNKEQDGVYDVYFCHQRFMQIDMREPADT